MAIDTNLTKNTSKQAVEEIFKLTLTQLKSKEHEIKCKETIQNQYGPNLTSRRKVGEVESRTRQGGGA